MASSAGKKGKSHLQIMRKLSDMQNSPDCYGKLEHKVISLNNNSLRFGYPLGVENGAPPSQTMTKLKEFGKECIRMGWLMAIEAMREYELK